MTNLEKIKSFNLDEMTAFLDKHAGCGVCSKCGDGLECGDQDCKTYIKEFLESESE